MNCPLCADSSQSIFAEWSDYKILQCAACEFRFINTEAASYPVDAQYHYDEVGDFTICPNQPHLKRRVKDILAFKQPPGRALDIGCGKGEVAILLEQAGFKSAGIDMKERLIKQLQDQYPQVEWRVALTTDLAGKAERFDLLTMYHVLEHIPQPRKVLETVKALANPGALIVIEVPNPAGLEARLKGRRWQYYKVDHVNYFKPRHLRRLAKDLDFEILAIKGYQHFSHPQDVWWKDSIKAGLAKIGFQDVISIFLRA
ncbi:MAG: methyltransferase [Chthoniobacteraceae bacterium]|nr:methyltransferase [Chthoniobacteraceae bacterium]